MKDYNLRLNQNEKVYEEMEKNKIELEAYFNKKKLEMLDQTYRICKNKSEFFKEYSNAKQLHQEF